MKKTPIFRGVGTAMITPFTDGNIDYKALSQLIEYQIKSGVDALIICGTTGEAPSLTVDEHKKITEFAIDSVHGRIPVVIGTGGNNYAKVLELTSHASKAGADGILAVTPYYCKATQKGLVKYYFDLAEKGEIPVIVYNVPTRTGVDITPETYFELSQHENINGVKEARTDITKAMDTVALCGEALPMFCGNDDEILPFLSIGSCGCISVMSNIIPVETQRIYTYFNSGMMKDCTDLQLRLLPLIRALFSEVNPIPVKSAVEYLKMCSGELRLPLTPMNNILKNKMIKIINDIVVDK